MRRILLQLFARQSALPPKMKRNFGGAHWTHSLRTSSELSPFWNAAVRRNKSSVSFISLGCSSLANSFLVFWRISDHQLTLLWAKMDVDQLDEDFEQPSSSDNQVAKKRFEVKKVIPSKSSILQVKGTFNHNRVYLVSVECCGAVGVGYVDTSLDNSNHSNHSIAFLFPQTLSSTIVPFVVITSWTCASNARQIRLRQRVRNAPLPGEFAT